MDAVCGEPGYKAGKPMSLLVLKDVTKVFHMGDIDVHALRQVSLTVEPGEFLAVMGSSGSGKSTLMNILGCLDKPSSGEYWLEGVQINQQSKNQLADIRNQHIGFVFQGFNLLARATALENVELPLLYDRTNRIKDPKKRAREVLKQVSLEDRMDHEPSQLSGGQQQRVAIARALVNSPSIIMADEPTGNLDSRTSIEVMAVFQALNRQGITIILVTHELDIAGFSKRVVELRDGRIVKDRIEEHQMNADEVLKNSKFIVNGNGNNKEQSA